MCNVCNVCNASRCSLLCVTALFVNALWESNDSRQKKRGSESEPLENGGYLLSHKCSTIGDVELNDPVRNGKGWDLNAITTLIMF